MVRWAGDRPETQTYLLEPKRPRQRRARPRLGRLVVDRGPVHSVAARRVATVGPVEDTVLLVELDIDRFRQPIEEDLDVWPGCRSVAGRNFDIGAEDASW
jgi:hypothetical protein